MKERIKSFKFETYKKTIPIVLIILVVGLGAYTIYSLFGSDTGYTKSTKQKTQPTKSVKPSNIQATGATLRYDNLPFFYGATETSRLLTEGDGVTASYQTPEGATAQVLLDYFETELELQGWRITGRDNDSKLEALSIDEVQLRVWIYFDGSDGSGVSYNVDFHIPGSEAWMPIPRQ